jgi:hypothetical protein
LKKNMPHGLWIHAAPFESIFQNRDAQKFKTCSGMMPSQVAAFGNWIMEPFDRCVCCDWICLYHDMSTMSLYDVGNHKPQKYPKINYPQCSHKWVLKNHPQLELYHWLHGRSRGPSPGTRRRPALIRNPPWITLDLIR